MTREEAIKELRCFIGQLTEGCQEVIKVLVPELHENEDERIRKELIAILKASYNSGITLNNKKDLDSYLAYLEKQKDVSKAIEAVDRIDKYIDEHVANAYDMKDSNPDKKYYRGWDDALGKMAGILQDVYSNEKQEEQEEQKPTEWSEKDENKLHQVMETLLADKTIALRENPHCKALHRAYDELLDWLKPLPERFNLQPKQEWSEEDEKRIQRIYGFLLKNRKGDTDTIYQIEKDADWLKSLRPQPHIVLDEWDIWAIEQAIEDNDDPECKNHQNALKKLYEKIKSASLLHWKPSEEQMNALKNAGFGSLENGDKPYLRELYDDIKTLM